MGKKRYLAAVAAAVVLGTTLAASPAAALGAPSFQQLTASANNGNVRSNCFFQVTYVSLVNGTVTGKMNGQAAASNPLASLGVRSTYTECQLYTDFDARVFSAFKYGANASTGIKYVTTLLSSSYLVCTYAEQLKWNGNFSNTAACAQSG
jgi:hypothetical protein